MISILFSTYVDFVDGEVDYPLTLYIYTFKDVFIDFRRFLLYLEIAEAVRINREW
jgi:hypothetical protein